MHGLTRSGRCEVPGRIIVYGGMGSAKIDFTQTEYKPGIRQDETPTQHLTSAGQFALDGPAPLS